jgi:glycosyltransferase involved in cell wall biosynthesis
MHSKPLVSILTPSFNQAAWLTDNLRSVANQSYPDIEHIVMDGGSQDGSVEVLRREGGSHVRWWSEPDRGQSHALNKALAMSHGEIIGWLNSDDAYFSRDAVAMAVQAFEEDPALGVVYGHAMLVNADGLLLHSTWVPRFHPGLLRLHNYIIQPAAFIRRSVLQGNIVDERFDYAMDRELWLRLAERTKFRRIDEIIAIDRHQPLRKSLTRPDLARADADRLHEMYDTATDPFMRARLKVLKIVFRLAGVLLLRRAVGTSYAFNAELDSSWRLLWRQLLVPRADMPMDRLGSKR